nr:MAG TPA: Cytosine specific methyltransferase [Caudoviricetes sp.]
MTEQMDGQVSLFAQDSWSGRTCRERSAPTTEKTSPQSSKKRSGSSSWKPPPVPVPEKGWATSGCLMGDGWSVAWRVLDAQFWGVPQRRRRIVLVADFGGQSAPEILFVRKGVPGDSKPGRTARKRPAGSPESGTTFAARIRGGCDGGGKGALVQKELSGTLGCNNDQTVFCLQGNGIDRADTARCNGKGWKKDVCYTLNTIDRPAVCAGFKLGNGEAARSIGYAEELAPTLNAECGGNKPAVLCLNDLGGSVMGISQDVSGTLRAQEHGHQPIVTVFDPAQITSPVNRSRPEPGKPCHTLTSRMGTGGGNVPIMFRQQRFGSYDRDSVAGSCKARDGKDGTTNLVCAVDCRNGTENPDTNGTLQAKSTGGQSLNLNNVVREAMTVRRLTPIECERLQGFPDGWTDIGEWVDSKGKKRQTTDSARYKALGNSIALPPWKWVLKRLCAQYERDATMASLFDGIGGFPLIWEQLNGKGSCLWASEIEEFPMAVTRKRFGGGE